MSYASFDRTDEGINLFFLTIILGTLNILCLVSKIAMKIIPKFKNYEVLSDISEMRKNSWDNVLNRSLYLLFSNRMFLRKIKKPTVNNIYSCRKNLMKL